MDCTQVLESDELNESVAYNCDVKVAELKVNDSVFPIFSGSNRIGRDPEFCSVVFNNMTLSKEHAVIEIEDRNTHLIYDLGSKNKTRIGKTTLKPHIRYQLLDKSQLFLGDLLAEYIVVPEEEENKPNAVIQESDDDIIPDTPVQSRSRESKESSSSREESPTIFQMETQGQLGYEEPCTKVVQEPKLEELEGNLAESSNPQDENKESCATVASSTSSTVSAAGSLEVNIGESDVRESTREVNNASDGDETDPEDVFFAMTQKRDESLCELSDKEESSGVKEMVENDQPEVRDQVENDSNVCEAVEKSKDDTNLQDTETEMELPSSPKEDDDVFSTATRAGVVEAEKVNGKEVVEAEKVNGKEQERGEENGDFQEEERSNENEENQKDTGSLCSEETNEDGKFTLGTVIKEHNAENDSKNVFKVPSAADEEEKREQTAQVILPVNKENTGEREETGNLNSETNNDSDDDSFFNAATQVIQQESHVTEVFKKPLAVKAPDQETGQSPERNKSCDNTRRNEGPGVSAVPENRSESSHNVSVQENEEVRLENKEESSSGDKQQIQEQDLRVLGGKTSTTETKTSTTEKDYVEDSDSTTDDESSFCNAPTQVIHTGDEHTKNGNLSPARAEPENPNCNVSADRKEPREKDVQEEEEIVGSDDEVMEGDDSIFSAPTQVIHLERKETIVSSDEKEIEEKQLPGTSTEGDSESDSIYEAATQVVHPENSHLNSLETSRAEKQTERKSDEQKQRAVPNSEMKTDDSIYEAETQVLNDHSQVCKATVTFKTSTPAKKKSVQFADIGDDEQSSKSKVIPQEQPKEQASVANNESDYIFRAPTQVVEPRSQQSSSSKSLSGAKALKDSIPVEESREFVSDPEITPNELDDSAEDRIHQLDDSDDSIFSAPTQIISKPNPMGDSVSPIPGSAEKSSSSGVDTKVGPEPALQIEGNNEEKICSKQDSDALKVASRNEDELNDSFFEAPTQLYASTTLAEELDSPDDEKANKSLSRSSSYSSIHEAPTQCMDDLVAGLDSNIVEGSAVKDPEVSGPSSNIQEGEKEISEGNSVEKPSEMLEHPVTMLSNINNSIDLILPSSQELRQVGQECYGYTSDDERPSTSNEASSPIIQKRTRSIPIKKGILVAEGLKSVKPTVATNSKSTGAISVKPLTDSDDKEQTAVESKKEPKKPLKERSDRKKTTGKRKTATAKENDNTKKITDYLESNNARPKNSEQESKTEENKTSDDIETGRPSRQRKPTWKARESSQDVLLAATPKTKKGENKEQSKVSPGSSKQAKEHTLIPNDVHIRKEDKTRKEKSKRSTKVDSEPCLNSESKLEDSEKGSRKNENPKVSESPSKQRKVSVCSVSPSRSEDEKTTMKKGVKMKQSRKEAGKSKITESSISPSTESKSRSSSESSKRKQTSVDPSSFKKRGRTHLLSSSSEQDDQNAVDNSSKGSNESTSNVDSKTEKSTTRSRRKPSNIPPPPTDQKEDISSVHENLQTENKNRKGRSKQSTIVGDSSVANLVSIPEHGKTQQDNVSVASNRRGNADEPSSNVLDTRVSVGKRGRQKRATTAISASSSDIEAKPVDDVSTSSDKQTKRIIQSPDDNITVPGNRRGRSKRQTTNSTSSSEVEIKSEGTRMRHNSSDKQRADSRSPRDQLDIKKRGRATRSAVSRASSVEAEAAELVTHNKRTQDSDICETPAKQRKTSIMLSGNVLDKNADVKRDRAKRTANKAFEINKESNSAVSLAQERKVEESDVCGTPRKQRKTNMSSLYSNEVENKETKRKGRSKKTTIPGVPLDFKKEQTSTTNVTSPDINSQPAPTTPRSTKQKRSILRPLDKTPTKPNEVPKQESSRSRKKGLNILVGDADQTTCSSPSYGSGRRRKVLSQASSTESDGHSSQSEGTPKRSSRIKQHISYHIMFTGVGCTSADETAIKKLGGKVVQEPEDCTILITDKIRRTLKFLCIMGQGKPIVTPEWIKQSHLSGHFLDPWKFIVKDKEAEKKYNFQLQKSLKEASAKKLLDGYSVFATPSVKPPPVEMKGIVENSGGQFLIKDPSPGKWPEKSFIISAVGDKKLCSKFKKSSIPIVSTEIVLTGILQQKLKLNDYILKL